MDVPRLDPTRFEPHYSTITSADQVQIYEAILGDTDGRVTTTLLRAARYLKDNRILPTGFAKAGAPPDIAVRGDAAKDGDFAGGGDAVLYRVDVAGGVAPFAVTAELLYQSIGYRWADNLRRYRAPEIERFSSYYQAVSNLPVCVATASARVPRERREAGGPPRRSLRSIWCGWYWVGCDEARRVSCHEPE